LQGLDLGLALGLVSLFPLDALLDIAAQGSAFGVGQDAGSVKALLLSCSILCLPGKLFVLDWILSPPFFSAIVKLDGQWLASLGSRSGPTRVPAILEAIPIGVGVCSAVGRAHA